MDKWNIIKNKSIQKTRLIFIKGKLGYYLLVYTETLLSRLNI